MKNIIALCAMCFGLCALGFAQETITLTTYYPSPFGSYNEMTVASRMAVGDVNQDQTVDVNDLGNIGFAAVGDPTGVLTVGRMLSVGPLANPVTPQAMFHVQGRTTANDAAIFMPGAGRAMRVGIGVTNPANDLSFGGEIARTIGMPQRTGTGAGQSLTISAGGAGTDVDAAGGNLILSSGISRGTGSSNMQFQTATSGAATNDPTTKMTIRGNGNVGIGTVNPQASLDVASGAILIPRNAADPAIGSSVEGMVQYNTSTGEKTVKYFNGTSWKKFGGDPRLTGEDTDGGKYVVPGMPDPFVAYPTNESGTFNQAGAINVCNNKVAGGYSDWVLPTAFELQVMCNKASYIGGFTASPTGCYWSSNPGIIIDMASCGNVAVSAAHLDPVRCIRRYH